jgi:condensin complex subunit 2
LFIFNDYLLTQNILVDQNKQAANTNGPLRLLDEPAKVPKIHINYDRQAKKVDVRALKESIWTLLEKTSHQQAATASRTTQPELECISFKKVVSTLDQTVAKSTLPDISVALSFICLLHLANEKGLKLESSTDMDELIVRQVS